MSIIYKGEPIWVGWWCWLDTLKCVPLNEMILGIFYFFSLCLVVGLIITFNLLIYVYVQFESWECLLSARVEGIVGKVTLNPLSVL
jgi:hypothetical protein